MLADALQPPKQGTPGVMTAGYIRTTTGSVAIAHAFLPVLTASTPNTNVQLFSQWTPPDDSIRLRSVSAASAGFTPAAARHVARDACAREDATCH